MKRVSLSSLPLAALVSTAFFSHLPVASAAKVGLNFQDDWSTGGGAAVTETSFDIPAANWINLPRVPNSIEAPFSTSTTIDLPGAGPLKVEWSAVNTYSMAADVPTVPGETPGADQVVYGYLDDSGAGYRVKISGFRNSVSDYKLTLIASTDSGSGFTNANAVHSSGTEVVTYGMPNPGDILPAPGGGVYAISPETAAISTVTENNSVSISGLTRSGTVRSTLAGIIIDYTPTATNVPVIEVQPVAPAAALFAGQSFTLSVEASGSPALTYQWRKGGIPISGNPSASAATFTASNISPADSGSYDVVVTGAGAPATSNPVPITVSPVIQPVFTTTPLSQSFYVGYPATFTSVATGGALSYTWKKEATTVGTEATLTLPNVTAADAGTYTVTATNSVGSVSSSVTLTVKTPVPGTYEAVQAGQKPLLWYRYSETDGSGIQDSTANLGTLGPAGTGIDIGVTYPAAGALTGSPDTAASLNGTTSRVLVAYNAALNTPQFTAEAWVKPALGGPDGVDDCVLSCGDFASPRAGWLIYQQPTGWNLRFYDQNGTAFSLDMIGGTAPVAGTWYHLAVTWDGTTATIYVNGVPTTGTPTGYVPGTAGAFCVGARADNAFWWAGSADEVAYYPTALSQTSVQAHYANGISPTPGVPYNTLVTGDGAALYLRLNDPAFSGSPVANAGTLGAASNGTYRGAGIIVGQPLIALGEGGPRPPGQPGFDAANTAVTFSNGAAVGNTLVPLGNQVTVTTWIKRPATSTTGDLSWPAWLGDGGMHLNNGTAANPAAELRYHWKGEKWGWGSGLFVPPDVWTFAAMVVEPAKATFYMSDFDENGKPILRSSVNTTNHLPLATSSLPAFGGNQPGGAARNFIGQLDESAVYGRALSETEILSLFVTGSGAPLELDIASGGVIEDTKPQGTPLPALNYGASWLASSQDLGANTRNGVQEFSLDPGDQLVLPVSTDFDSPVGTLCFWMKSPAPSGPGNYAAMLFDHRTTTGTVITLADSGTLFVQCSPNGLNTLTDSTYIADELWHHVAVTWNQDAAGTIAVYVDGGAGPETTNTGAWTWPAGVAPLIGKSRDPYWRRFAGQLDDFRIYSQILSAAEIAQIKNSGDVVVPAALKVRYDFGTAGRGLTLSWPFGVLESSATMQANDPWLPVPGATSPFPVNPAGSARFFRARLPQ